MRRCCRCCPRRHTDGGPWRLARGPASSLGCWSRHGSTRPYLLSIPRGPDELNTPARAAPRLLAALGRAAALACRSGWTAALASLQFACLLLWSCRTDRAAALACCSGWTAAIDCLTAVCLLAAWVLSDRPGSSACLPQRLDSCACLAAVCLLAAVCMLAAMVLSDRPGSSVCLPQRLDSCACLTAVCLLAAWVLSDRP